MKIKEVESFIKIRRGLMEHIMLGKMNGKDLSVYVTIHLYADYETGLAPKLSAPFIAQFLSEKIPSIQTSLRRLEKNKYIKRFNHRGQKTYYPILINKFETPLGFIVRADKSLNLSEIIIYDKLNALSNEFQVKFKTNLKQCYCMPIQEVKKLRIKRKQENKNTPDWKKDFDVYLKLVDDTVKSILDDPEKMAELERLNPNLDIKLSLEKSVHDYWGTEDGWKNKKKSRGNEINMKTTLIRNMDKSKVWKSKSDNNISAPKGKYDDYE